MGIRVKAMYEGGVLKPLEEVNLKEGEKIEIEIEIFPDEGRIEEAFKELEEIIPSIEDIVDISEISMNKYMDRDYALKKIGI